MAVDTKLKRQSATGLLLFSIFSGVDPSDLIISYAQRHAVTACYAGTFLAIGIMSKPTVSAGRPSITATGKQPNVTVSGAGPSISITAKGD